MIENVFHSRFDCLAVITGELDYRLGFQSEYPQLCCNFGAFS